MGVDTVDRPTTEELLAEARALKEPSLDAVDGVHAHLDAEPSAKAFQRDLYTYMRGVRSASVALGERTGSRDAEQAERFADSVLEYLDQ